ncbi:hypothetical protein BC829DRAFT_440991 [Chytridium lagenaria]|nr:hypothetical protein BC829DRAFT_440991 [Chytridium lagenaria]
MRITALLSLAFALQAASLPLYLQQDQVNLEAAHLISPDPPNLPKTPSSFPQPLQPQQPSKQNPPPQAHMPAPYRDYQTIMYERYVATNGRNMPVMTPAQASKDLSVSMSQIQAGIAKIRAAASTSASASGPDFPNRRTLRCGLMLMSRKSGAIQNSANAILKVAETAKAADKVVAVAGNVGKAAKTASVNVKKAGKVSVATASGMASKAFLKFDRMAKKFGMGAVKDIVGAAGKVVKTAASAASKVIGASADAATKITGAAVDGVVQVAGASVEAATKAIGVAADTAGAVVGVAADVASEAIGVAADTAGTVGVAADVATGAIGVAADTAGTVVGVAADVATGAIGVAADTAEVAVGVASDVAVGAAEVAVGAATIGCAAQVAGASVDAAVTLAGAGSDAATQVINASADGATQVIDASGDGVAQVIDASADGVTQVLLSARSDASSATAPLGAKTPVVEEALKIAQQVVIGAGNLDLSVTEAAGGIADVASAVVAMAEIAQKVINFVGLIPGSEKITIPSTLMVWVSRSAKALETHLRVSERGLSETASNLGWGCSNPRRR